MKRQDPYRESVKYYEHADDQLVDHENTCGECTMQGPCPLYKELLEEYNFAVMAVRMYERGKTETALPRL